MAKRELPTIEMLHKLLVCDAKNGLLWWKERTPDMFAVGGHGPEANAKGWNKQFAGKRAFTVLSDGYHSISIFNKRYLVHRVIWAIETGAWPVDQIDHEDHNRGNNRFKNLREATHVENARNQKLSSRNTSGVMGVGWNKSAKQWIARIYIKRKELHLGSFDKKDDAIAARKAAEKEIGFHKNHGRKEHV